MSSDRWASLRFLLRCDYFYHCVWLLRTLTLSHCDASVKHHLSQYILESIHIWANRKPTQIRVTEWFIRLRFLRVKLNTCGRLKSLSIIIYLVSSICKVRLLFGHDVHFKSSVFILFFSFQNFGYSIFIVGFSQNVFSHFACRTWWRCTRSGASFFYFFQLNKKKLDVVLLSFVRVCTCHFERTVLAFEITLLYLTTKGSKQPR